MTLPLFDLDVPVAEPAAPAQRVSPGGRRTIRQREVVAAGGHPLALVFGASIRRHTDPDRTCGNCRFRELLAGGRRRWPKCTVNDDARVSHGAATDVRAWWPACADHEWGDTAVGPDAARWVP